MQKTSKEKKNVTEVAFPHSVPEEINGLALNDETSADQQENRRSRGDTPSSRDWLEWVSKSTILGSIGYAATYITGLAYHQCYLRLSHIPPELFTKTPTEYFIYAYTAGIQFFSTLIEVFMKSPEPWVPVITVTFLGFALIYLLFRASESKKMDRVRSSVKSSRKLKLFGNIFFLPMTFLSIMAMTPVAILTVAMVPVVIGYAAANQTVKNDAKEMAHGCAGSSSKTMCYDLMDGETLIARGFVIEASGKYIALRTDNGTAIFPLKERSIQGYVPSAPKQREDSGKVPTTHE